MSLPVLKFANRLANATTTSDRISSLCDLQTHAKKNCAEVGQHALQMVVDLLKENGEPDEYMEALDLISRLVNPKYGQAARDNGAILLSEVNTVELLLDLLEHQDGLVAVMASEILTNVHSLEAERLESMIQMCPAGMTKLLNRVPDRSREEVSNQAIILIQQLTVSNEEMKKAVAFNEGFDTLFGIIESEGGVTEPCAVVQDCLQICCNVLNESETCQRLFYEMGGAWHFKLLDFFSPDTLERLSSPTNPLNLSALENEEAVDLAPLMWFEQPLRVSCAIYALKALLASLGDSEAPVSKGKLTVISSSAVEILRACAHWLVRGGPREMLPHCFLLVVKMAVSIETLAARMFEITLKYDKTIQGTHVPPALSSLPHLHFNWSPSSTSDQNMVSLPCLLADRYIYPCSWWAAADRDQDQTEEGAQMMAQQSLLVLNTMLRQDEMASGMVLQHILAPPPPDDFLDETGGLDEASLPMEFGSAVLSTLVKALGLIVDTGASLGGGLNPSLKTQVEIAVRASNILALIFIHGGILASELSTALSTAHVFDFGSASLSGGSSTQPILSHLLSLVSRLVRLPGVGYTAASAVLRVLSGAACGCERASRQMLEDPSNLFVIELASQGSENAGVSKHLQVMCCLFLGCVFESFSDISASEGQEPDNLSRNSILGMIDTKIGLSRFSDLIKVPLSASSQLSRLHQSAENGGAAFSFSDGPEDFHFVEAYQEFYEGQAKTIKNAIYSFYSGSSESGVENGDTSEAKIIKMQIETIAELELALKQSLSGASVSPTTQNSVVLEEELANKDEVINKLQQKSGLMQEQVQSLTLQVEDLLKQNEVLSRENAASTSHENDLQNRIDAAEISLNEFKEEHDILLEKSRTISANELQLNDLLSQKDAEIVLLKEEVLSLVDVQRGMTDEAEAAKRRLRLLEEDLKSPMPFEKINENKICDLEKRNTDLKTQLWEIESSMKSMQSAHISQSGALHDVVVSLVQMLDVDEQENGQDLTLQLEACVDVISRLAGQCSDIAESFDISFNSTEDKPAKRVIECVDKFSERVRCDDMKILEGERFRNQLSSAENELDRLQEDYDTVFSRLSDVEEENTTLHQEIRANAEKCSSSDAARDHDLESREQHISALEVDIQAVQEKNALVEDQNKKLSDALKALEDSVARERKDHVADTEKTAIEISLLKRELGEYREGAAENASLKSTIEDLHVELAHYKGEIARIVEENGANLTLISTLSEEYAQLQDECDDKKVDFDRAESKEAMLEELRSDFRQLTEKCNALQHEKKEVEDVLEGKEVNLRNAAVLQVEMQQLHEEKSGEYKELLERYVSQKEELLALTVKANNLSSELANAAVQDVAEPSLTSTTSGKIAGLKDVIRSLEGEVEDLSLEKETISAHYTSELQTVRDHMAKLAHDSGIRDEELAAAQLKISDLEGAMATASHEPAVAAAVVKSVSSRLVALSGLWSISGGLLEQEPRLTQSTSTLLSPQVDTLSCALEAMDHHLEVLTELLKKGPPLSKKSHLQSPAFSSPTSTMTPVKGQGSPHCPITPSAATTLEAVRTHTNLRKERVRLHNLQEQHADLLGLLAQQEIELQVYRQSLVEVGGSSAFSRAENEARGEVTERYGYYVNFRDTEENVVL